MIEDKFTDYQILVLAVIFFTDLISACVVWFVCFALIRFDKFRNAVSEAIQNADEKFHWQDAKNVSYLVAGFLSASFTANIIGIFVYAQLFDVGPAALVTLLVGVTFTLFGIAWKKN